MSDRMTWIREFVPAESLYEKARSLNKFDGIEAPCPQCGEVRRWWNTRIGRLCGASGCDFKLGRQPPPDILCSSCGEPLERADTRFHCQPCGRVL